MFKIFFALLPTTFLLLILVAAVTDTIQSNSLLVFVGYFFVTLFSIKIFKNKWSAETVLAVLFVSMLLIQSYTIYLYFVEPAGSLPIMFIYSLGIISAYLYLKLKPPVNIFPVFLSSLILTFMFFQGWEYWQNKVNFGTFTGKVEAHNLPAKFEAFDHNKDLITDDYFQNKIVLLDFWYTGCGVCFEKFPFVQFAYDKYKNDSSVAIFAVNKPIEEDRLNQAFEMIREEGHTFPVLITKDEDLAEKFGVSGYPTTFVINQNGQIVYKGDIEGAVKMIDELKLNSR